MFKKFLSFLPQIVASLFLAGFVVYAWTGPTGAPPTANVDAPVNVGPTAQTKQGGLTLGGVLKVEGNLLDNLGRIIYNAATSKIERARMPFEQGDITSDVDTNTYDAGYFDVSSLIPANIKKGIAFGRAQIGTVEPLLNGDLSAFGILGWNFVTAWLPGSGATCKVACNVAWWTNKSYVTAPGFIAESDPRGIMGYQMTSQTDCWSGGVWWGGSSPCVNNPLPQGWTITCAPGYTKQYASGVSGLVSQYSPCTNGSACDYGYCIWGTPLPPPPPSCPPYCGGDE